MHLLWNRNFAFEKSDNENMEDLRFINKFIPSPIALVACCIIASLFIAYFDTKNYLTKTNLLIVVCSAYLTLDNIITFTIHDQETFHLIYDLSVKIQE